MRINPFLAAVCCIGFRFYFSFPEEEDVQGLLPLEVVDVDWFWLNLDNHPHPHLGKMLMQKAAVLHFPRLHCFCLTNLFNLMMFLGDDKAKELIKGQDLALDE